MPNIPIVDSHVHLYDPNVHRMTWLDGNALLNRRYDTRDFREHTRGVEVESLVFLEMAVDPAYGVLEANWVDQLVQKDPIIGGIVAWAPIMDGERVRSYLQALKEVGPRVKGVRFLQQTVADPNFALQPGFVRGVQMLPEYGFSFDICIYHYQLTATIELVKQCPDTQFVLDHMGKPDIKRNIRDPWMADIARLAALPNVSCKLSGVVTEADHRHWTYEDVRPYMERVLEVFPEDRVMYGGDWTVVLTAAPYLKWIETVDRVVEPLSDERKRKFWNTNARQFYRLG